MIYIYIYIYIGLQGVQYICICIHSAAFADKLDENVE